MSKGVPLPSARVDRTGNGTPSLTRGAGSEGADVPALARTFDLTPKEAVELQRVLRDAVRSEPLDLAQVKTVGGADISANRFEREVYAGVVVLDLETLETLEEQAVATTSSFPYVPGLLSFREIPPLMQVWERLTVRPDVLICDGQGIAHPRRIGLASHTGLSLDVPTVGCAKSLLVGRHEELGAEAGSQAPLYDRGELIGMAVRLRERANPVYVSVGHRVTLEDAVTLVRRCAVGYRLPETTRRAHALVNQVRRGER